MYTSDHILDVVSVARAVDVCVVSVWSLVLHMGRGDGDPSLSLLRGIVNVTVRLELCTPSCCQHCVECVCVECVCVCVCVSVCVCVCVMKPLVMAEVSVVLPWSTWPMVPMFMCGLSLEKTLSEYHLTRKEGWATTTRALCSSCRVRERVCVT